VNRYQGASADIGVVGMAVMGQNLALNIADKGFRVAIYNRTEAKTRELYETRCAGKPVVPAYTLEAFVSSLKRPRAVMLLVKAGEPTDRAIGNLLPLLERGDTIIDGGNAYFRDTDRRFGELLAHGIRFIGCGVSGGESGALNGPSLMPGGDRDAYDGIKHILTRIAAQTLDGPCCAYLGPKSAGHFVKMVHNGIEYGVMQVLAEAYDIMRSIMGMSAAECSEVFREWNRGELNSYLVEIAGVVTATPDVETGRPLVDLVLDQAEQKGTGIWTSLTALELGIPVPAITAAVDARTLSSFKDLRTGLAGKTGVPAIAGVTNDRTAGIDRLRDTVYMCMMLCYAQGFHLLHTASSVYGYGLPCAEIARIWKGGCIVRAAALDIIRRAYTDGVKSHLCASDIFTAEIRSRMQSAIACTTLARSYAIPAPAMNACMDYLYSLSRERLPAGFIQALRDHFGAHTFRRIDREGVFHVSWE